MKYNIICDYNESFESKTEEGHINDHQTKDTFIKINDAINRLGYQSTIFGGVPELIKAYNNLISLEKNDIFINLSDGTDKKYSRVQVPLMCELLGIKYSGGGTFETALTSNKFYSSLAVKRQGLLAPENYLISRKEDLKIVKDGKYIVKPNSEGSSIGIDDTSVSDNLKVIKDKTVNLLTSFSEVVIEEYIPGYDATCFVIGNEDSIILNEPLLIEHHNKLVFNSEVMGYREHVRKTRTFISCEGILPTYTIDSIRETSCRIKKLFNILDFCRIDYRITEDGNVYFLEINTVPAISEQSQVGVICDNLNISFDEFIEMIIITITERFNRE
ncbi:MAG: hypothetical protein J5964_02155 [Eubacterium sp.]|nr:hypothetical protein [Eubacterium sp.]